MKNTRTVCIALLALFMSFSAFAQKGKVLFGIRIKDIREIIGQIPRLLVGGVKSFVGEIPVGNTGGANVPPHPT